MTPPKPAKATRKFRRPGRPTRLTTDLATAIIETVADGNYIETAAALNGVGRATIYRWLRRADDVEAQAREHAGDDDSIFDHVDPADWPYVEFRDTLKAAEAHAEVIAVRDVRKAGPGWQAHMTFLERRHPDRWRRRERVELDATIDHGTERTRTVTLAPGAEDSKEVLAVLREAFERPTAADQEHPDQED